MAKGTTLFTKVNLRTEAYGYGTGQPSEVADESRRMAVGPTGIVSFGEEWDLGADRTVGLRNPVVLGSQTITAKNPTISLEAPSVPTDELPYYLSMLQEPTSSSDESTYRDWVWELGGTTIDNPTSMEALISDGNLNLFANGIVLETLELSAQSSGLTGLSASGFAKQLYPTETAPAAPVPSISPRSIAGRVWQAKLWDFFPYSDEGTGEAFEHLYDWTLSITSGNGAINAQVGSVSNAGVNPFAVPFGGTLSMTVASSDETIAPFIDNRGGNIYVELAWADAGDPAHSVNIRLAGVISSVEPLSGDQDGITTYAVEVTLAHDTVTGKSVDVLVTNQMADLSGNAQVPA
jgi:hypothetical protein